MYNIYPFMPHTIPQTAWITIGSGKCGLGDSMDFEFAAIFDCLPTLSESTKIQSRCAYYASNQTMQ